MPNRILRDGILTSEPVDRLGWAEEVFYRRLYSIVDDHGRFYANPKLIRAAAYPLKLDRVSDPDIGKWLTVCVEAGLVRVYSASDEKRYIQILKFNQRIQAKSKFPDPCLEGNHSESPCFTVENRLDEGGDEGGDEGDNPRNRASADADLFPDVPEQVVRDFKAIRRTKRAAITPTAMAGIVREAEKAGMTLAAALAVCCERGWAGFKAEWVTRDAGSGQPTSAGTPRKRRMLS